MSKYEFKPNTMSTTFFFECSSEEAFKEMKELLEISAKTEEFTNAFIKRIEDEALARIIQSLDLKKMLLKFQALKLFLNDASPVERVADCIEYTVPKSNPMITMCTITVAGFSVVGFTGCADPSKYSKEEGERWAKQDAVDKLKAHVAFLVKFLEFVQIPQEDEE